MSQKPKASEDRDFLSQIDCLRQKRWVEPREVMYACNSSIVEAGDHKFQARYSWKTKGPSTSKKKKTKKKKKKGRRKKMRRKRFLKKRQISLARKQWRGRLKKEKEKKNFTPNSVLGQQHVTKNEIQGSPTLSKSNPGQWGSKMQRKWLHRS